MSSEVETQFLEFRDEIDAYNDRRERLIKVSRDVTALSKKAIFVLHRIDLSRPASTERILTEARGKLDEIVSLLTTAAQQEQLTEANAENAQRYERNIAGGVEEFIESLSFYHYLRYGTLITLAEVQRFFNDSTTNRPILTIPPHRYLLGLSDLTGELMRLATNAVGMGDTVTRILLLVRTIHSALDPFVPLIRDMRKKQAVTAQSLYKIEHLVYAITVRSSEFSSDPKALQEMVRRSLANSNDTMDDN